MTDALPDGQAQRVLNKLCPGGIAQVTPYRVAGLASPLLQGGEVCNIKFQKVLENIGDLDDAALKGLKKLSDKIDDVELSNLLVKYADDPDPLKKMLGVVEESKHANWTAAQADTLVRLVKNSGGLTSDAIKHLPLNTLDETLYPGFADFLVESGSSGYLSRHASKINDLAAQGNVNSVRGHMSNLVGEFREKSFAKYADSNGHQSLFKHAGEVNEPGLDALTKKGDHFFLGEVKDRGIGAGTIADGSKSGGRLSPNDLGNYMEKTGSGHKFNDVYFRDKLQEMVNEGIISPTQRDQILQAAMEGNLELIIFAGGRAQPFTSTLNNITQLVNPFNPNSPIKVRLIIDNF
jgi:hypothetical protein